MCNEEKKKPLNRKIKKKIHYVINNLMFVSFFFYLQLQLTLKNSDAATRNSAEQRKIIIPQVYVFRKQIILWTSNTFRRTIDVEKKRQKKIDNASILKQSLHFLCRQRERKKQWSLHCFRRQQTIHFQRRITAVVRPRVRWGKEGRAVTHEEMNRA